MHLLEAGEAEVTDRPIAEEEEAHTAAIRQPKVPRVTGTATPPTMDTTTIEDLQDPEASPVVEADPSVVGLEEAADLKADLTVTFPVLRPSRTHPTSEAACPAAAEGETAVLVGLAVEEEDCPVDLLQAGSAGSTVPKAHVLAFPPAAQETLCRALAVPLVGPVPLPEVDGKTDQEEEAERLEGPELEEGSTGGAAIGPGVEAEGRMLEQGRGGAGGAESRRSLQTKTKRRTVSHRSYQVFFGRHPLTTSARLQTHAHGLQDQRS